MNPRQLASLFAGACLAAVGTASAENTVLEARTGSATGVVYEPELLGAPPAFTDAQLQLQASLENRVRGHGMLLDSSPGPIVGPAPGSETNVPGPAAEVDPQAPGSFVIFGNYSFAPTTGTSVVNEPSNAQGGKYLFYTGNWYALRSGNQGQTVTYVNPYADFADFCCDQDVIYDKGRDLHLWYRQGVQLTGGNNRFRLGVSTNGGRQWTQYTITYTNYSGLPLGWFDYPHLALTNNYLYITSNYFNTNGTFQRMVLTKISLDQLQAKGAISWTYWSRTSGYTWTPAQGGTEVLYLGDHTSTTSFNVCDQPESNSTLTCRNVAVPAWSSTGRGSANCPVPNGADPCARLDQRINAGYLRNSENGTGKVLGFMWTVREGGGFNFPYVNAVAMDASTFTVLPGLQGRPYIYSSGGAWFYAGAAPNERGHLGVSSYYANTSTYPRFYVMIDDDYNGAAPGYEIALAAASTTTASSAWGDYTRVRPNLPTGTFWNASGAVQNPSVRPYQTIFGRDRDRDGWLRFRVK